MFQKDIHKFSLILAAAILLFTNPTYSEEPTKDAKKAQEDFYIALQVGNRAAVEEALNAGAVWTPDGDGKKPHMFAAESGDVEFYMWAEKNDSAGANDKDNIGRTALYFATLSQNCSPHMVRYLRSGGADVNAQDSKGNHTPLFNASIPANLYVVEALFEKPMDRETFLKAFRADDPTDYHALIDKAAEDYENLPPGEKVDVTAITSNNETPLHVALGNGESELAEFLLRKGVPMDIRSNDKIIGFDGEGDEILRNGETAIEMAERELGDFRNRLSREENDTERDEGLIENLKRNIAEYEETIKVYHAIKTGIEAEALSSAEEGMGEEGGSKEEVTMSPERKELLDHIAEMYVRWREEFEIRFSSHRMSVGRELLDLASEKDIFRNFFTLPGTAPTSRIPLRFHEPSGTTISSEIYVPSPYWYCDKVRYLNITREEYLQLDKILREKGIENVSRSDLAALDLIDECSKRSPESSGNQFDIDITLRGPKVQAAKDAGSGTIIYTLSNVKSTTPVMGISLATYPSSDYLELFELLATFDTGKRLLKTLLAQINSVRVIIRQPMLVPDKAREKIPHIFWGAVGEGPEGVKVLYIDRFTPLGVLLPEFFQALIETNDTEFDSILVGISADYYRMSGDDSGKSVINYILKSKVPALMRILNNPVASPAMKLAAIRLLGSLGPDAEIARGALGRQVETTVLGTPQNAAARKALAGIGRGGH